MTTATATHSSIEEIELERTGKAPLHFQGRLLTTASGQFVQTSTEKPNPDYYQISIYQLAAALANDHEYVIEIVYTKEFRGQQRHHTAILSDDPAAALAEFNPLAVLIGFPPHQEYAERQQMLETKCRRQFDLLVSAVLKLFPDQIGDVEDGMRRGQDVIRYRTLLEIGRREFTFTQAEAGLMCDALNGTWLLDDHWRYIAAEIEDACQLNQLDQKWETKASELLDKLRRLSPLGLCAVADAVERFWQNPNQELRSGLQACGLIRAPSEQGHQQ